MLADEFISTLEAEFHPDPYPEIVADVAGVTRLFVRRSWHGARYCLALVPWTPEVAPNRQLGLLRHEISVALDLSQLTKAGVLLVWYGDEALWREAARTMKPDFHGVREVIFQGLSFVDPQSGASVLRQAHWGPIRFGNWQGQFSKLEQFLNHLRAA